MYEYDCSLKDLEGKTLTRIDWDRDKDVITFAWDGGQERYGVEGDCCSTSWFDSFEGAADIIGSPIVKVTELDLPDLETDAEDRPICTCKNCNAEYGHGARVAVYGFRIETNEASATLEFRNDSNGYYGGYLRRVVND